MHNGDAIQSNNVFPLNYACVSVSISSILQEH